MQIGRMGKFLAKPISAYTQLHAVRLLSIFLFISGRLHAKLCPYPLILVLT